MSEWLKIAWGWLQSVDVIFGILSALFAFFAAFRLHQQNRRLKQLADKTPPIEGFKETVDFFKKTRSSKPVAVAFSLKEGSLSIKQPVHQYLKENVKVMPIKELVMNGIKNENDLEHFINELRVLHRELEAEQATELHIFFLGPVMASVLVGAAFKNWIPVMLYQKTMHAEPNHYEFWGPLQII